MCVWCVHADMVCALDFSEGSRVCGVYMLIWCVPWISVRGHVCVWCVHADMVCALDFSEGSRVCVVCTC